jgi:hypothetical protein
VSWRGLRGRPGERAANLRHALEPVLDDRLDQLLEHVGELARHVDQAAELQPRALHREVEHVAPRERHDHRHPERVQVRGRHRPPRELLHRHVAGRAHHRAVGGRGVDRDATRGIEVDQHRPRVGKLAGCPLEHDVRRLDVAVQDRRGEPVQVVEDVEHAAEEGARGALVEPLPAGERVAQVRPLVERLDQHELRPAIGRVLERVVDLGDPGVLQPPEQRQLALEQLDLLPVLDVGEIEDLERDLALRLEVTATEHP